MSNAPHIYDISTRQDLVDWGVQPDAIAGDSHSPGMLVHKGLDNRPETGTWVCTSGTWRLALPRDEFCHFVDGHATYISDEGEVMEVKKHTVVMFPKDWSGQCKVHSTTRNVYIIF
jgi:uncharacterized cupin superfamily protein